MNALIPGIGNHEKLTAWFNELWDKSEEFRTELMEELLGEATMPPLTSFQIVAVKQALQILKDYGGVFVADVVGTGKTYIGTALLKHLQMLHGDRPLIICPKSIVDTWKDFCREYGIQAEILSMGMISQGTVDLINDPEYRNLNTVLIDMRVRLSNPSLHQPLPFNIRIASLTKINVVYGEHIQFQPHAFNNFS